MHHIARAPIRPKMLNQISEIAASPLMYIFMDGSIYDVILTRSARVFPASSSKISEPDGNIEIELQGKTDTRTTDKASAGSGFTDEVCISTDDACKKKCNSDDDCKCKCICVCKQYSLSSAYQHILDWKSHDGQFMFDMSKVEPVNRYVAKITRSIKFKYVVNSMILTNIFLSLFVYPPPSTEEEVNTHSCFDSEGQSDIFFSLFFLFDCIVGILGQAKEDAKFNYFWSPIHGFNLYNWIDIVVVAMMWVDVINNCLIANSVNLVSVVGLLRVFRIIKIIMHIKTFRIMFNATKRVIPAITPQLALFFIFYYGFAILGQTVFAGCVTEHVDNGGPGDWSTEPWKSTDFGEAPYYYNLNFDNLWASFVTLFMLMIQNNWHGALSECTESL